MNNPFLPIPDYLFLDAKIIYGRIVSEYLDWISRDCPDPFPDLLYSTDLQHAAVAAMQAFHTRLILLATQRFQHEGLLVTREQKG